MTRLLTYNNSGDTAPTNSGTVVVDTTTKWEGADSLRYDTTSAYSEWTIATTLTRAYYIRTYFRASGATGGTQALLVALNTASAIAFRVILDNSAQVRIVDSAGSFSGSLSSPIDYNAWHLIEVKVVQPAAGNGTLSFKVDGVTVQTDTSISLTNTAMNRFRFGRPANSQTPTFWHDAIAINDDQGAAPDNTFVGGAIPPAAATELRPSGTARNLNIPSGLYNINNIQLRSNTDRVGIRFVLDKRKAIHKMPIQARYAGVDTDGSGAAAPAEINTGAYADGNGGTIEAALYAVDPATGFATGSAISTFTQNAVDNYIATKAYFGITGIHGWFMPEFNTPWLNPGEYIVIIRNTHASALSNWISINCPVTSQTAAGPHASNTRSKFATGAIAGLDPREAVMWSVNSGTNWYFGGAVGGDTTADGLAADRVGGHISGYYSGNSLQPAEPNDHTKLPQYGFVDIVKAEAPGYRDVLVSSDLPGAISAAAPFTRLLLDYNYTSGTQLVINTPDLIIESLGTRRQINARLWIQQGADRLQLRHVDMSTSNAAGPSPVITGAEDVLIEYCDITNANTGIGMNIGNATGTYGPQVLRPIIRYNRFHDIGTLPRNNHEHAIYAEYCRKAQIYGNVIWNIADRGIQLYPDCDEARIHDNIIYNTSSSIVISGSDEYGAKQSEGNRIYNNVFANTTDQHLVESFWDNVSPGANNKVEDNWLWGSARDDEDNGGILTADGGFEALDNVLTDPMLANQGAFDFTIYNSRVYDNFDNKTPFKLFTQAVNTSAGTFVPVEWVDGWESGAGFTDTDINVSKPNDAVAGDVLIATLRVGGNKTISTPSGWTKVGQVTQASGTTPHVLAIYAIRYATGTSWLFTWDGTAQTVSARCEAYRGVRVGNLVDASSSNTGTSTTPSSTGVTTLANFSAVVFAVAHSSGTTPDVLKPTNFVKHEQFMDIDVFDWTKQFSGGTGVFNATLSPATSTPWSSWTIAMRPALQTPSTGNLPIAPTNPGALVKEGIQPYYAYKQQSTNATARFQKAGRTSLITKVGAFTFQGDTPGVLVATNVNTGLASSAPFTPGTYRNFNGSTDKITTSIGGINLTGAFTLASIFRLDTINRAHTFFTIRDSGGVHKITQGIQANNLFAFDVNGDGQTNARSDVGSAYNAQAGRWYLFVATKGAGSVTPRFHIYDFVTRAWTHKDAAGVMGDATTQATGSVVFGEIYSNQWVDSSVNWLDGDLGEVAVYNTSLSDAQTEAMLTSLTGWGSPVARWKFNQAAVTTSVTDSIGSANQTARTGTTVGVNANGGKWEANLATPVLVSAGETLTIGYTGTVNTATTDLFLEQSFNLGSVSGDFPFSIDGGTNDRAEVYALPWPYFAPPQIAPKSSTYVPPATSLNNQVWPVINTSVLGGTYAPLAYPAATTKRYIHAQNGNDANDGLTWGTAWKGLYNAWETAVSDPGGQGVEIWCDGSFDLTSAAQFYPSAGQLLIANVIDGTATAPRSVRAMPGCEIIKGWITLRTPNYNRFSGFTIDGKGLVPDQLLRVESATTTAHFEHSYNTYKGAQDQAVLIDTGNAADFHGYNNRYEANGNYRHTDGTRGHFDQPLYVKKCPRYLEVNPVFVDNIGGYSFHAFDSTTGDPANGGRLLHATSVGTQPFSATGNTTSASPTIANAVPAAGKSFYLGQVITGTGMGTNAQIDAIAGTGPYTLTMSVNSSATNTGVALTVNTPSSGGVVDSGENIIIANSIFKDHHGSGVNSSVMGLSFRFVNTVTGSQFRSNLTHNNLNGFDNGGGATVTGTLTSDPLFTNASVKDFTPTLSSPTVGAGENWGVIVDHYGRARPSVPSIGAIEPSPPYVSAKLATFEAAAGSGIGTDGYDSKTETGGSTISVVTALSEGIPIPPSGADRVAKHSYPNSAVSRQARGEFTSIGLNQGSEGWYGMRIYIPSGFLAALVSNISLMKLEDAAGAGINVWVGTSRRLFINHYDGNLDITTTLGAPTTPSGSSTGLQEGQWNTIELRVLPGTAGAGVTEVRVNGRVKFIDNTRKNVIDSTSNYNLLYILHSALGSTVAGGWNLYVDEAYVGDA